MFNLKNVAKNITESVTSKAKEIIGDNIDEKVEEIVSIVCVIAFAGFIFSAAGKMIPSRTNLHVYVHIK